MSTEPPSLTNVPRWPDDGDLAFLSFSLGPVQSFIASARTVRDLWTGSYLLSFLTFEAMKPVLEEGDREQSFVMPDVTQLPLWLLQQPVGRSSHRPSEDELLLPCIPNIFIAVVPGADASRLAKTCEDRCRDAWRRIAVEVRGRLDGLLESRTEFETLRQSWAALWNDQIESFFEIRTVVLPWAEATSEVLNTSLPPSDLGTEESLWSRRLDLLGRLMQARRSIRHVASYLPAGLVPQKCTLLGTLEQMGPTKLEDSREFFEQFANRCQYEGTRTGKQERLCAVSLVKRYAWPCFLAGELDINPRARRFADTATIAAAKWLEPWPSLNPQKNRNQRNFWSGQWLHWKSRNEGAEDGEEEVPKDVWDEILDARSKSKPPTYYAVLMIDGDEMGKWLRGEFCPEAESRTLQATISRLLTGFAVGRAPEIVKRHTGELIYSGGDEVLALLPTESALACGLELRNAYRDNWPKEMLGTKKDATVSAGIALVHYKEDLRFALDAARKAEKAAKNAGRDALGLSVCRRSGEHSTALVAWDQVGILQDLVQLFIDKATDRWTYTLRRELPTLAGSLVPDELFSAELSRLLERVDSKEQKGRLKPLVESFLAEYLKAMSAKDPERKRDRLREDFVTLCQSASFLARGRDQ
jgi:CRISPR-associated protein Cmr2